MTEMKNSEPEVYRVIQALSENKDFEYSEEWIGHFGTPYVLKLKDFDSGGEGCRQIVALPENNLLDLIREALVTGGSSCVIEGGAPTLEEMRQYYESDMGSGVNSSSGYSTIPGFQLNLKIHNLGKKATLTLYSNMEELRRREEIKRCQNQMFSLGYQTPDDPDFDEYAVDWNHEKKKWTSSVRAGGRWCNSWNFFKNINQKDYKVILKEFGIPIGKFTLEQIVAISPRQLACIGSKNPKSYTVGDVRYASEVEG